MSQLPWSNYFVTLCSLTTGLQQWASNYGSWKPIICENSKPVRDWMCALLPLPLFSHVFCVCTCTHRCDYMQKPERSLGNLILPGFLHGFCGTELRSSGLYSKIKKFQKPTEQCPRPQTNLSSSQVALTHSNRNLTQNVISINWCFSDINTYLQLPFLHCFFFC